MSRHHGIVEEFLESNFGEVTKFDQLQNARKIYDQLLGKQRNIEHQLSVIRTAVPTKIEGAIRLADAKITEAEDLMRRKDELVERINVTLVEAEPLDHELNGMVLQVKEIERFVTYLQWIERIEDLSGDIQRCILCSNLTDACTSFSNLLKIDNILTVQEHSTCDSLVKYIVDTIFFWNQILKEKLSEELDVILKKIGWPYILAPGASNIPKVAALSASEKKSAKPSSAMATTDLAADFERIINNLLLIQLPPHLLKKQLETQDQPGLMSDAHILLPIQLLLKPLRKRFRYHFSGNKQTNSIAKPEWYLTQILNWVGNHKDFLEVTVQPILESKGFQVDSLVMFTKGLLHLINRKLSEDIDQLLFNDDMFSHTVDEVLLFDRELRGSHHFSPFTFEKENPLNVFMSPECIQKWISIEKACALDRLDAMLSSSKAWESQYGTESAGADIPGTEGKSDEMLVPECAESFITMLLTITDRYKSIPTAGFQFKFLELQLHLLDDFRIRLTQVLKNESNDSPLSEKHFAVINAAYYVCEVLKEWAENTSGHLEIEDSVFDAMLQLYDRLHKDGIEQIARIVFSDFEIKGWGYVSESWLTLPSKDDQLTFAVSRTACPMLLVLQERVALLNRKLCPRMFTTCWHKITDKVDSYLFQQVVMRNKFNSGGALQLEYDMTRNLFPLFSPYSRKPENYFRRMKEACTLLNLQPGSALLLSEILNTPMEERGTPSQALDPNRQIVMPSAALNDIDIMLLSPENAARILKLRIDWPLNN